MNIYKAGHRWGGWTLTARRSLTHESLPDREFSFGGLGTVRSAYYLVARVAQEPGMTVAALRSFAAAMMDLSDVRGADGRERERLNRGKGQSKIETAASQDRFKAAAHVRRLPGRVG